MKELLFLLLTAPAVMAAFPQPRQNIKLAYGQQSVDCVFETDGSDIKSAKPLCDCTTLRVNGSRLYVHVDCSKFDQDEEKQIDVLCADGSRQKLRMNFSVPQPVILSSRSFIWQRNAAPAPQELRISIPKGSPVSAVLEAGLNGSDFDYATKRLHEGREYAVILTPKSTAKKCLNRLVLKMQSRDLRFSQRIIYLQVK